MKKVIKHLKEVAENECASAKYQQAAKIILWNIETLNYIKQARIVFCYALLDETDSEIRYYMILLAADSGLI